MFTSNLERIDSYIHSDSNNPAVAKQRRRDITNGYRYDPDTGRGAASTGIADGYETNEEFIVDVNEAVDPD